MKKIEAVRRILSALDECDNVNEDIEQISERDCSRPMKDALLGAVIERRGNLLDQLRRLGLDISEEV